MSHIQVLNATAENGCVSINQRDIDRTFLLTLEASNTMVVSGVGDDIPPTHQSQYSDRSNPIIIGMH